MPRSRRHPQTFGELCSHGPCINPRHMSESELRSLAYVLRLAAIGCIHDGKPELRPALRNGEEQVLGMAAIAAGRKR